MTTPLYPPTRDTRLAVDRRDIERLLRRQQLPGDGLAIPYAILEGGAGGDLPGPSGGKWWWDMIPPVGSDFTNAPDTFANATRVITAGGGNANSGTFHGLSFLQAGMYLAFKTIQIGSLYNDTVLRAITIYQGAGLTGTSDMVFGDQNHVNQGHGFHFELWSIDEATVPTAAILLESESSEASDYACDVNLLVVKLDPVLIGL